MNQVFVTKLDTAGNAVWASKVVSTRNNSGNGIEFSKKTGLLVVAGKMGGSMGFDGGISLTSSNGTDNIFVGKIDTLGTWISATKITTAATLAFGGLAIDANDNMFVSFSTYIQNSTPINAYKADGTTVSSNFITGLNITSATGGLIYIARISSDYSTSSKWVYQTYQTVAYNNCVAVGKDNNPVFIFNYKGVNQQASYQVRKLSNDLTTNNAIWARNVGGTYFNPGGVVVDKDTTTSVLFGSTGGTLDNTSSGASTINLPAGANFHLARINSKGQWLANPNSGTNGANLTIDGIVNNGGLGIDTTTKEIRAGVNLAYLNFTAANLSLNPKAPLAQGKHDAFLLKYGCVNAGFFTQPKDSLACPSGTIYAKVEALGSNLTYTWKKNNTIIGTNAAIYSKASAAFADSGSYKVDVRSVCFKDTTYATSNIVKLGVKADIQILQQPIGDTLCFGDSINLKVKATGYGLKYVWTPYNCNGCNYSTLDYYKIKTTNVNQANSYNVVITDVCSRTKTSNNATIVLETPITNNTITASATTCEQGVFTLSTAPTSTGNYESGNTNRTYTPKYIYNWKKDNVTIPNSNVNPFVKSNASSSDIGNYVVEVTTRGCKNKSVSAAFSLNVNTVNNPYNSASNLKFFMPFNGTFADESGVTNFVTSSTTPFIADRNAVANSAINFTTANNTNQIRVKDSLFSKSTIGTLSFWFKTSAFNQVLFGMQDKALNATPSAAIVNAYIDYSGFFRGALYTANFNNTALKNYSSKTVVNDNKWHNVVITYNTNTQSIFIDGILQYTVSAAIATSATISTKTYLLTVAQFGATAATGTASYTYLNNGSAFVGQLDDISVHGVAYDACDVARLYTLGITSTPVGIEENTLKTSFSIAPNPFENDLILNSEKAYGKVTIADITGKIVVETVKTESEIKINTAQLPSGIYFVKLGNEVIKVVK